MNILIDFYFDSDSNSGGQRGRGAQDLRRVSSQAVQALHRLSGRLDQGFPQNSVQRRRVKGPRGCQTLRHDLCQVLERSDRTALPFQPLHGHN